MEVFAEGLVVVLRLSEDKGGEQIVKSGDEKDVQIIFTCQVKIKGIGISFISKEPSV